MSETEVLPEQGTRIQEDVRPDLSHGDGDHERFAHYVDKNKIVESAVTGDPVVALAAGAAHACAARKSGAVDCWGANGSGQLGDGTRHARSAPRKRACSSSA